MIQFDIPLLRKETNKLLYCIPLAKCRNESSCLYVAECMLKLLPTVDDGIPLSSEMFLSEQEPEPGTASCFDDMSATDQLFAILNIPKQIPLLPYLLEMSRKAEAWKILEDLINPESLPSAESCRLRKEIIAHRASYSLRR